MSGTELSTVLAEARDYVRQAKAPNTIRAYQTDWRDFMIWCGERGRGQDICRPAAKPWRSI